MNPGARRLGLVCGDIWGSVHLDLARAWRDQGHAVSIFTLSDRAADPRRPLVFTEDGLDFTVVATRRHHPLLWLTDKLLQGYTRQRALHSHAWALGRWLRQAPAPDAVFVEGDYPLGWLASRLPRPPAIPLVIGVHDTLHLDLPVTWPGRRTLPRIRAMKQAAWRAASWVRANSAVTREALLRNGADPARSVVIPLHTLSRYDVLPRPQAALVAARREARAAVLAQHGLPPAARLLVSLCRLSPEKGLDIAAAALAAPLDAAAPLAWLVCGPDRGVRRSLEAQAASLSARLICTGDLDFPAAMRQLLAADLHLAPSRIDTFNYAALEAALCGTPSLLSPRVGIGPWLTAAGAARIAAGDARDWRAALQAWLATPAAPLEETTRETLRARLAPRAIAQALLDECDARAPRS